VFLENDFAEVRKKVQDSLSSSSQVENGDVAVKQVNPNNSLDLEQQNENKKISLFINEINDNPLDNQQLQPSNTENKVAF